MNSKFMTIGMQNKLQNKNRKKGCPIDRRTIKKTHMLMMLHDMLESYTLYYIYKRNL